MKLKKKNLKVEYGTISLPLPLIEKVKKQIEGTGMNSVSAYVAFILREILSENPNSKANENSLRQRLKNLGYF